MSALRNKRDDLQVLCEKYMFQIYEYGKTNRNWYWDGDIGSYNDVDKFFREWSILGYDYNNIINEEIHTEFFSIKWEYWYDNNIAKHIISIIKLHEI